MLFFKLHQLTWPNFTPGDPSFHTQWPTAPNLEASTAQNLTTVFTWDLLQKPPRQPFVATNLCAVVFCYERWRSLSVLASPTSLFRSWAPNYCWHGQEPGYNFHPTRVFPQPRKQNRLWPFGPLALCARALKPPTWPALPSCFQGEEKSRHHQPPVSSSSSATAQGNAPAVGTESGPPAVPRRMVVDALRRGRDSSASTGTLVRGQRSAFFFPAVLV